MVSTRRSANVDSSPKQDKPAAGSKRKEHADDSKSKHEPKAAKRQITLEETISGNHEQDSHKDIEMKEASEGDGAEESTQEKQTEEKKAVEEEITDEEMKMAEENDAKDAPAKEEEPKGDSSSEANAVQESSQRKENLPSNILEKGIVYFFIRNRVGIDDSESVGDLQRTYFVLRPLPIGAELGDGAIPDANNNRLFALPKKVFPKSANDRFMAFVEKSNTSIQDLKDNFFQGTEYKTQTSGTRQNNPVAPVGEGVYAITRTEDRSTHLAFALTIPTELGEVQTDLGLRAQGSFHISVKNPERPGPASARLPQGPGFPKEIIEEFRGLAWAEVKPKYLDYENCQILLIGEDIEKAVEQTTKDAKHDKVTPKEELEQLEHEDELRINHLHGNDSVFDDLQISKKHYAQVPTTW